MAVGPLDGELKTAEELGRLKSVGRDVKIYRLAQIIRPALISIGHGCQIDDFAWIHGGQGMAIGNRVHICAFVSTAGGGVIRIGNYVGLAAGVRVVSGSDNPAGKGLTNPCIPEEFRSVERSHVEIEDHAVILTNAILLPGVTVGEGAVVMPRAVVRKSVKPWGFYDGNPAVRVCDRPRKRIQEMTRQMVEKYGY